MSGKKSSQMSGVNAMEGLVRTGENEYSLLLDPRMIKQGGQRR